jgi:trehalose-6-phosphate synthase
MANDAAEDVQIDSMRRQILGLKQIIGVDRLDYSKGLPGRMQAFARLLKGTLNKSGRQLICRLRRPRARRLAPMLTSGHS